MRQQHSNVDGAKELPSFSTRKSPRNCVRKVKMNALEQERIIQSEPRKIRKRKSVSYVDDPSYSEEEYEEEFTCQAKKVSGYRCSPHLVPEVMEQLTQKQRDWVGKIDFGSLQQMVDSRCPKSLTMWLVDRVNSVNGTLEVCGKPVDIKQAVERILKLPSGGVQVPQPMNGRSKAKRAKTDSSRADEKHSEHGRGQIAKDATRVLLAEHESEVHFCQSFVMLMLCIYLAPTTSLNINRGYYPSLLDISTISKMDWCGFIAEYLIRGIEEYRQSKASHVQVPGCVHILPLLYIDALIENNALVLPEALSLPQGFPRIHFIGTDHLDYLASADLKLKSKDRIEFGLLQEKLLSSKAGSKKPLKQTSTRKMQDSSSSEPVCHNGDMSYNAEDSESNIMESLFSEIRANRVIVVQEFERKLEQSEDEIFNRFRALVRTQKKPEDKSTSRSVDGNKSCCQRTILKMPSSSTADLLGKSHNSALNIDNNQLVSDPQLATTAQPSPSNSPVVRSQPLPSPNDEAGGPDHPSQEEVFPNIANHGIHSGGPPPEHPVEEQSAPEIAHLPERYNPCSTMEALSHRENSRKSTDVTPDLFRDELEEVVNIGIEAAMEACTNQTDQDGQQSSEVALNILSETAMNVGDPLYDMSPAVPVDARFFSSNTAISPCISNISLNGGSTIFSKPMFDESPVPPSLSSVLNKGKLDALLSIPEFEQSVRQAGPASVEHRILNVSNVPEVTELPRLAEDDNKSAVQSQSASAPSHQFTQTQSTAQSEQAYSSEEMETDTEDGIASERDDDPMVTTPDFILTPSFTYDTQDVIDIADLPVTPRPRDIIHLPPLQKPIELGFRFILGGSVTCPSDKLSSRFNKPDLSMAGTVDYGKFNFVLCKDAAETYKNHVTNSPALISPRNSSDFAPNREKSKIQIKDFHVTKGDFVDSMKPNGEVSQNFMGLCSSAIMCDWETSKRIILDQATIRELMKPGHECDQKYLAAKLLKRNIKAAEEIFLPILKNNHWILIVVNVLAQIANFYDSVRVLKHGENPHLQLWLKLAGNLEECYCLAKRGTVAITFFRCNYPTTKQQSNTKDCGYHVIQTMECYNTEDYVGFSQKRTMLPYRKYLAHLLVYHRFNDLNPCREGLRYEAP